MKKVKKINSKAKGSAFEREIAHYLTKKTGKKWIRSPQSGAYATLHRLKNNHLHGDVVCEDPMYKNFYIECKSVAKFPFHQLLDEKCPMLEGWLNKMVWQSFDYDHVLFFKVDRLGTYVAMRDETFWYTLDQSGGGMPNKYYIVDRNTVMDDDPEYDIRLAATLWQIGSLKRTEEYDVDWSKLNLNWGDDLLKMVNDRGDIDDDDDEEE